MKMAAVANPELRVVERPAAAWPDVAPLWSELVSVSQCSFFLTTAWVESWLEVFGTQLHPSILTFTSGSQVVGACLLVNSRPGFNPFFIKRVSLNTWGESATDTTYVEFNNLLTRIGWEAPVAKALAEHLRDQDWDEFNLPGFSWGPAYDALKGEFDDLVCEENPNPCHHVDLAALRSSGRTYEMAMSAGARKHLRQNIRYHSEMGAVRIEAAADLEAARAMFEELAELSRKYWATKSQRSSFSSLRFTTFHRALIGKCFASGGVQMLRISAGQQTIGVLYNLIHRGKVYFYQCGYLYTSDKRLSPGRVALSLAIQYCLDAGYDDFDFLSGQGKYKEWMSTDSRSLVWATFKKPLRRLRLLHAIHRIKEEALG
jgi:CelD/BcsL family acetyltransferase involved in cellulose biosynthesis